MSRKSQKTFNDFQLILPYFYVYSVGSQLVIY